MKKIIVSKKGFTLTEIIIVVAIIVFLSAAAFVGVGATINHAKATQAELQAHNGENFEAEAWDKVKNINSGAAEFFDDYYYNPDDPEDGEPDATAPEETGEGEPSVPDGPGPGPGGGGGGEEPKSTEPQPSEPTKAPTPIPTPTKAPTPTPKPAGDGNISVDKTVTSGTGVKSYSSSSDGTASLDLVYKTYESTTIKIRKNDDGSYSLYIDSYSNNPIGDVIGWNAANNWCSTHQWLDIPSGQWNKLCSTYGFKLG